jgi:drug/metabolite transporter (DMT)-like permease
MPRPSSANYRLGCFYALVTVTLLATQEPFSYLAAKRLSGTQFVFLTQASLLLAIPLLLVRPASRRDFGALLRERGNWIYLGAIAALGMSGLALYNLGLSGAHPIIIAAVLNLSPFWAALVARVISGVPVPVSASVFFGCLAAAFLGATMVAWSQLDPSEAPGARDLVANLLRGSWIYAVPIPILSALNGTLIGKWFSKYDESGAIAANFLVSTSILIPATLIIVGARGELKFDDGLAIALMIVGTIVAAAIGRVFYQIALSATGNDNGFVTMFFLLAPGLAALLSLPMSWWIADLHFRVGPAFFIGLVLIAASLLLFSLRTWRHAPPPRPSRRGELDASVAATTSAAE